MERKEDLKGKFIGMKTYEVLFESTIQCLLNLIYFYLRVQEMQGYLEFMNYLALYFSLLSLLVGIYSATKRLSEKQERIQLQPAGRMLITLLLTTVPFSSALAGFIVCILFQKKHEHAFGNAMTYPVFVSGLLRVFTVGPAYFLDELVYIIRPSRQRRTTSEQFTGLFGRIRFWTLQPTIVELKTPMCYLPYLLLKIVPTSSSVFEAIQEYQLMKIYFNMFVYVAMVEVMNILYFLFLCKPSWFFRFKLEKGEGEATEPLRNSNTAAVEALEGSTQSNQDVVTESTRIDLETESTHKEGPNRDEVTRNPIFKCSCCKSQNRFSICKPICGCT